MSERSFPKGLAWLAIAGLTLVAITVGTAQQQQRGTINNFTAAPEFYPPPHHAQMKSLLQGAQAELHPSGLVTVKQLKLETFRQDGQRELLVEAPQCVYDPRERAARSPGRLKVQSGDGKMLIEGEGFLWRQTNSSLIISNQVHTSVQADAMNSASASTATNRRAGEITAIDIDADTFGYEAESGLGVYRNVRVTGTNLSINSGLLTVLVPMADRQLQSIAAEEHVVADYEGIRATGERFHYDALTGLVRVSGQPHWRAGLREGSGDELLIDRTNKVFRTTGNAMLRLAGQKAGAINFVPAGRPTEATPAVPAEQAVEIRCHTYEIHTNSALFQDAVQVTQSASNQPDGRMRCARLTVGFAGTNELQSMIAENQVVIEQAENRFTADRAEYQATNGVMELTGSPAWRAGVREGKGDFIRLNITESEMAVLDNATMRLPAGDLVSASAGAAGKTNAAAAQAKTNVAEIFSERYILSPEAAIFEDKVRVEMPQMTWNSGIISVRFPGVDNQNGSMVAERGVTFDLTDQRGATVQGRSEKAVYSSKVQGNITNNMIELTGNPILETTNGIIQNKILLFDLASQRLIAPGKFKIRGFVDANVTNSFRLPKVIPEKTVR